MANELNCKWLFGPEAPGNGKGPANAADLKFKGTIYSSLIRESIQNSMDAALDSDHPFVEVNFSCNEFKCSDFVELMKIKEHIEGCLKCQGEKDEMAQRVFKPMLTYLNSLRGEIGYLCVSDSNTKGMDYVGGDTNSTFYAFAHAEGKTVHDDSQAGGAFGFGKTVFYTFSPINTVFVTTRSQNGVCFQGISKLCTHTLGNDSQPLASVGLYDTNGTGVPVQNEDDIPEVFRRKESGTGTSIFVIGIRMSDFHQHKYEMIEMVLRNYWMAILNGKLKVTVDRTVIDCKSIDELMLKYFSQKGKLGSMNHEYNPYPFYILVKNVKNGKDTNVWKYIEEKTTLLKNVGLYYYKGDDAVGQVLFMRKPEMTVYVSNNHVQAYKGVTCVFVCNNPEGNQLLREMEDPAHDSWKKENYAARSNNKKQGSAIENEYKNIVKTIIEREKGSQKQEVHGIKDLEKYLYVSTPYSSDDRKKDSTRARPNNKLSQQNLKEPKNKPVVLGQQQAKAKPDPNGRFRANERRSTVKRRKIHVGPGNMTSVYRQDDNGKEGLFAVPVEVSFRSWAEEKKDSTDVVHVIRLFSDKDLDNVCIQLFGSGADGDVPLDILEVSHGIVIQGYDVSGKEITDPEKSDETDVSADSDSQKSNKNKPIVNTNPKNAICNISIRSGQQTIKVKFNSSITYSLRINADTLSEKIATDEK